MSNISEWDVVAANNNTAPPDGWPENMSPASANDAARENMGALARFFKDSAGKLTSTGSGNAYVLTTNSSHASFTGIGLTAFIANHTNTGAATLNVDGLGVKSIEVSGSDIIAGDIVSGSAYLVAYNATGGVFEIFGVPQADVVRKNAVAIYTASQHFTPSSVTSSSNATAINMATDQVCKHTFTEDTTISAPSNLAEGMSFRIAFTQHASSAKILAWNAVFKGAIPAIPTTTSAVAVYYFDCYDGTNLAFTGWTGEIT